MAERGSHTSPREPRGWPLDSRSGQRAVALLIKRARSFPGTNAPAFSLLFPAWNLSTGLDVRPSAFTRCSVRMTSERREARLSCLRHPRLCPPWTPAVLTKSFSGEAAGAAPVLLAAGRIPPGNKSLGSAGFQTISLVSVSYRGLTGARQSESMPFLSVSEETVSTDVKRVRPRVGA